MIPKTVATSLSMTSIVAAVASCQAMYDRMENKRYSHAAERNKFAATDVEI